MSSKRFDGRRVYLTGAASGVGRATAQLFAAEGAHVYAVDVNIDGVRETAEIVRATGGTIECGECNVAEPKAVKASIAAAVTALGGLNILINAAGVGRSARFEEIDEDDWRRVLSINLDGAFYTIRNSVPHLLAEPAGSIVNVASIAGMRGQAYNAHYCASKAGLINLTRSLAVEFASRGLRANCVCPGGIMTPFIRNFIPRPDFESNLIAYYSPPVPHKLAAPEDIAKLIAFLASDDANHINGATLVADNATIA